MIDFEDKQNLNRLYGKFASMPNRSIALDWATEWQEIVKTRNDNLQYWLATGTFSVPSNAARVREEQRRAARASRLARYFMGLEE